METYLFFIIILFILATSDLVVGVANDAVNFLNSAIGSKVAPRHIILVVASLGVLAGTLFSSGMMEVARSGFFNPELFRINELMVLFLAVMFTDVLLLDFYNTFGLPTSTTVSLVSSLFAGSVALAVIKINQTGQGIEAVGQYINSARALGIFSAILISVVISFVAGAVVQYISRLIFTFDFQSKMKRYGALWGALALTSITYFIVIKGAKGTSFLTEENVVWIKNHTMEVLAINFAFWAVILQLFLWFTKVNVFKPIVLIGTFSLALAFAANDLVNFIGVPLAGLSSFQIASSSNDPLGITLDALREPERTNSFILTLAGVVMILTLWFNRKARTVTRTEINLGRQFEGYEKFDSSTLARSIVRISISLGETFKRILPKGLNDSIQGRFNTAKIDYSKFDKKDRPSFDYVRAIVNLMVSSSLISLGTAYKLPLSTTYVTFIVAMSTSFADKAWGRESAVYRVSGVLTVVAGWFFTAFLAFVSTTILTTAMFFGGLPVILIIAAGTIFLIVRSNILHRHEEKKSAKKIQASIVAEEKSVLLDSIVEDVKGYLSVAHKIYDDVYSGLTNENRKKLKKAYKETKELEDQGDTIITKILQGAQFLDEKEMKEDFNFGKAISSLREISDSIKGMAKLSFDHIDNNHAGLAKEQKDDFKDLKSLVTSQLDLVSNKISKKDLGKLEDLQEKVNDMKKSIKKLDKNQIGYIKKGTSKARTNLLFLNILFKSENISNNVIEIIKFNKELLNIKQ
ncbi:MAG: inorganic phosphate transporter [Bacteroidota bacterium]